MNFGAVDCTVHEPLCGKYGAIWQREGGGWRAVGAGRVQVEVNTARVLGFLASNNASESGEGVATHHCAFPAWSPLHPTQMSKV